MAFYPLARATIFVAIVCYLPIAAIAQNAPAVPVPSVMPSGAPATIEAEIDDIIKQLDELDVQIEESQKKAEEERQAANADTATGNSNSNFPVVTVPDAATAQDPDLQLFESWLNPEDGEKVDGKDSLPKIVQEKSEPSSKPEITELPEVIAETELTPAPKVAKKRKSKKSRKPAALSYRIKQPFTYKSWRLPRAIYKDKYMEANKHLPVAVYEEEYDAQLFAAAARNDVVTLRVFLETGRNVEMANPAVGESLLLYAVRHRALNVVQLLLGRGADPNRLGTSGGTALHYAVANQDYVMAEILLSWGAEPKIPDSRGMSPLQMAEQMNNSNMITTIHSVVSRKKSNL